MSDQCNAYLGPLRVPKLCVPDGERFGVAVCRMDAMKKSCGGKCPEDVKLWDPAPKPTSKPAPTTTSLTGITTIVLAIGTKAITLPTGAKAVMEKATLSEAISQTDTVSW